VKELQIDVVGHAFGQNGLKAVAEWSTDAAGLRNLKGPVLQVQLFQDDTSNVVSAVNLITAGSVVSLSVAPYSMGSVPRIWMGAGESEFEAFNALHGTALSWEDLEGIPRQVLQYEYLRAGRELVDWLTACGLCSTDSVSVWAGNEVDRSGATKFIERQIGRAFRDIPISAFKPLTCSLFLCDKRRDWLHELAVEYGRV
jgi:hypothetical protein